MLGRLLSNHFGLPDQADPPANALARALSPSKDDTDDTPSVPASLLDEAETRALLYGPSLSPHSRINLDVASDLRVVVACNTPCLDYLVYDSVAQQPVPPVSPLVPQTTPANRTSPPRGARQFVASDPRISTLPRSMSSITISPQGPVTSLQPQATARHRRTSSSISASQTQGRRLDPVSQSGPDVLPLPLLKEVVFGCSPIRVANHSTKIHPLPIRERQGSTDSRSSLSKGPRHRTWLVSKIFKIGVDGALEPEPDSVCGCDEQIDSVDLQAFDALRINTAESTVDADGDTDEDDDADFSEEFATWNPKPTVHPAKSPAHTKDVECAICVYINLPIEAQDTISNHWDELNYALADIYTAVNAKLQASLPHVISEIRHRKLSAKERAFYSLNGDTDMKAAVDQFKTRFVSSLRIPRILYGQDKWAELFRELGLAFAKWETPVPEGGFLSAVLSAFIATNSRILATGEFPSGALHHGLPVRTVIVSNNRIVSRKLIFILTSLLRNHTSQLLCRRMNEVPANFNHLFEMARVPRSTSISSTTSMSSSPVSKSSAKFSSVEHGWEIPFADSNIESSPTVAIPHVVRPSFSTASLEQSLSQRSTRRSSWWRQLGIVPSSVSSNGPGSFMSNFYVPRREDETPATSFDDYYFHDLSPEVASSVPQPPAPRPQLLRCHSSERSATTLGTTFSGKPTFAASDIAPTLSDSDLTVSSDDSFSAPTLEYHAVDLDDDAKVVEVGPPSLFEDSLDSSAPIVLPPVAGHIPEFHPGFIVQACPLTRDIDDKVARTMMREGRIAPSSVTRVTAGKRGSPFASFDSRVITDDEGRTFAPRTRTLVINLRKREVTEYLLGGQFEEGHEHRHVLVQRQIFTNGKICAERAPATQRVSKQLRDLYEQGAPADACIDDLMTCYETFFGILD